MLWEGPSEGRPVCTVVLNDLYINNAIIGSELEHAVGGATRREAGMYSCMEWFIIGSELKHAVGGAIRREAASMYSCMEWLVYKQCHHWLRNMLWEEPPEERPVCTVVLNG